MKLSLIADLTVKIDEEAYMWDVNEMWAAHEEHGAPQPLLPSGYGQCTTAVVSLSAELATDLNLHWECCYYTNVDIKISGDGAQDYMANQYREYERQLKQRLIEKGLDKWAKVQQ